MAQQHHSLKSFDSNQEITISLADMLSTLTLDEIADISELQSYKKLRSKNELMTLDQMKVVRRKLITQTETGNYDPSKPTPVSEGSRPQRTHYCAGYIIFNSESKMLCILNNESGMWGFPKGHIMTNEYPRDAANRELMEETSVVYDARFEFVTELRSRKNYMFVVRIATLALDDIAIDSNEIGEFEWLTSAQLHKRHTSRFTRCFLAKLLKCNIPA